MDAYSYQPCPSIDSIKKDFLEIMTKKYKDKDTEFLETIVNDCVDKFNQKKNLSNYSYSGYIMFMHKDLMKNIDESILLTIEDI